MNGNDKVTAEEGLEERIVSPEMALINIPERGISIEQELKEIEKNIEFFNKVKVIALKMTKPSDWVDMGGPYLMDRGAENVAIAFGVDISDLQLKQDWAEDSKGRYYTYIASGKAYARKLGRYVEDIGVCSQRDKFFGMANGQLKEIQEVDMANIRRKAVTNLYSRLIKRVIGLMGITWEDLAAAGIKREQLQKVEYRGGQQGGGPARASALSPDHEARRTKCWKLILELKGGDAKEASALLDKLASFGDKKVTDIGQISSDKWVDALYGKVKKECAAAGIEIGD
jgi:hypothetical protein